MGDARVPVALCPGWTASMASFCDAAKPDARVTVPVAWMRELLAYVRALEAERGAEMVEF